MTKISGGEIIKNFLQAYEIPFVFGNPGTTETVILEAISHCENTTYILALQESSVIGIAAGYALATKKPAVVNIHTYPGLANSMCNMYNAFTSGIPLLVIAGQQTRASLIHEPVLSGPLTQLAETAVKYSYEVLSANDLALALQRCYTQAMMMPTAPTFLSIPMDILKESSDQAYFKYPKIYQASIDSKGIEALCDMLAKTEKGKLAFVLDYEAGTANCIDMIDAVATHFKAHVYASPYHVQPVLNPRSPCFTQILPVSSDGIYDVLKNYETIVVVGRKIDTFLFTEKPAIPSQAKLIQISSPRYLSFDYPCDLAISGDINAVLMAIIEKFKLKIQHYPAQDNKIVANELMKEYQKTNDFSAIIIKILAYVDKSTHIITEGSSEDALIQKIAAKFGFVNVFFSPRGGGLGWAMPLATGISLALGGHSICFVGDGGSLYAIHTIWTAAKYRIPVIFVCFINHEYKILKNLWCKFEKTKADNTHFIGLDLTDPQLDMLSLAKSLGAATSLVQKAEDVESALKQALQHQGPSFIGVFASPPIS